MDANMQREIRAAISSICLAAGATAGATAGPDFGGDDDSRTAAASSSPRAMEPLEQRASPKEGSSLGSANDPVLPQDEPLVSPCRNTPNEASFRSLPATPPRASASNNVPPPPLIPLPSPIFLTRFTLRHNDDGRQVRPLPQARFPPPAGPPPRAETISSTFPPRISSSSPSSPDSSIIHADPLGSNPPQRRGATMERNPQFPSVPSSTPMSRAQEALRLGNALRTGMQPRPDAPRPPRLFPLPPNQPDGHGVQRGQQYHWNLPGREIVSLAPENHPITERITRGEFLLIRVGGIQFRLPMHILSKYPFWSALTVFEPPPQGWSMPDINTEIFSVLIECVYSTCGLHGTENGLNLVKLCYAFDLARTWSMIKDRRKLRDTMYRYILRRILQYNPSRLEDSRQLNHNHHLYRSEELYRTWELAQMHDFISKMLTQHDLIALYCCIIPQDLWPVLTARFDSEFTLLLHVSASARRGLAGVASGVDYRRWWLHYYRLAGFEDANWLSPEAHNHLFAPPNPEDDPDEDKSPQERAEFEATRARGNALVNAFEAQQAQQIQEQPVTPDDPVTLAAPVTPTTSDIPATSNTQPVEVNDAPEHLPPPRSRPQTRRVRFAPSPQVIALSPQMDQVPMTAHDAAVDSTDTVPYYGEASRAA
ncbi:hypothetical protein ACQKWADRAFT_327393 [Trichoderma austrokoningii]